MKRYFEAGLIAIIAGALFIGAAAIAEETISVTAKTVEGEVSGVTMNNISIVYQRDSATGTEYEMLLPVEEANVQYEGIKNKKELKTGETVRIEYDELVTKDEEGMEKIKRKTKKVKFLRPAKPELSSDEQQ